MGWEGDGLMPVRIVNVDGRPVWFVGPKALLRGFNNAELAGVARELEGLNGAPAQMISVGRVET